MRVFQSFNTLSLQNKTKIVKYHFWKERLEILVNFPITYSKNNSLNILAVPYRVLDVNCGNATDCCTRLYCHAHRVLGNRFRTSDTARNVRPSGTPCACATTEETHMCSSYRTAHRTVSVGHKRFPKPRLLLAFLYISGRC